MVKQNQKDILDILIGSGSDLTELLTPDREVIGFQALRDLDMESMDFLADDSPISGDLCGEIPEELYGTVPEVETSNLVVDGEVVFDPSETNYELLEMSSATPSSSNTNGDLFTFSMSDIGVMQEVEISEDAGELTEPETPISPVLKMGLKNKIKSRRIAQGKEDIQVLFPEPEPEKLTEEEEDRRRIRREKNKEAAQKCRSKKRKLADTLEEQTEKLEDKRDKLTVEIEKLLEERDHLKELIAVHCVVCPKMAKHVCVE